MGKTIPGQGAGAIVGTIAARVRIFGHRLAARRRGMPLLRENVRQINRLAPWGAAA
jgi:hypothetical protein